MDTCVYNFILTAWFDVGERGPCAGSVSTVAASVVLFTTLIAWTCVVLNNRDLLTVYMFFLWIVFVLPVLVIPGYFTYKNYSFYFEEKVNKQWSSGMWGASAYRTRSDLCVLQPVRGGDR